MELVYQLTLVLIAAMAVFWFARRKHIQKTHGISPVTLLLILIAAGIAFLYIPYYWVHSDVWGAFTAIDGIPALLRALAAAFNAVCMGILEIPRHFALALEFQPATIVSEGKEIPHYFTSQVLLWILAPLGTASFVFMLVSSLLKGTRLKFSHKRPVYYFSSLNEKSFTLASSLYNQSKDKPKKEQPFLVFCQVDVGDESNTELQFSADAEKLGAIFEKDPVHAIQLKDPLRQQVKIFLMDENEDDNILSLLRMEESICPVMPDRKHPVINTIPQSDIYIFSTHESSELLFDQTLGNFNGIVTAAMAAAEKKPGSPLYYHRYNLHLIDETKLIVQKLLLEHPLFEPLFYVPEYDGYTQRDPDADRDDHISVLAIGGGQLGMELVRSAMVCGITDNYQFDIQIIDQNAKTLEKQFRCFSAYKHCFDGSAQTDEEADRKANAPIKLPDIFCGEDGLGTSIKPVFHEVDCRSTDFDAVLENHCRHSNYIVVATGDDELNISTARYLQRWYARFDIIHRRVPSRPPMIFAAIRNSERYEALKCLEKEKAAKCAQQLFLFGNHQDIFSADEILSRKLDASAAVFNDCYAYDKVDKSDKLKLDNLCTPLEQRTHMRDALFKLSQVMQLSNHTVALHSLYKLQDLLFSAGLPRELLKYRYNAKTRNYVDTAFLFHTMAKQIRSCGEKLHRLEHRRWNLFYLLDGWECFPMQMIPDCLNAKYTPREDKPHQLPLIKLHGCLVPFDDLDKLGKLCKKDFKGYDACMCAASVFAWLDLEADPDHAAMIRSKLMEAAHAKWNADVLVCTCDELLELVEETFDPVRLTAAAK